MLARVVNLARAGRVVASPATIRSQAAQPFARLSGAAGGGAAPLVPVAPTATMAQPVAKEAATPPPSTTAQNNTSGGSSSSRWHGALVRPFTAAAAALVVALFTARVYADTSFRKRRVADVKERLKRTLLAASRPQVGEDNLADLFLRPSALQAVSAVTRNAGLFVICGPKGEGKSSLMALLEALYPCVIRVDLQRDSMDKAVRAVAAAMGYHFELTTLETAAKLAGAKLPDLHAVKTKEDYKELLEVFEQACKELREKDALGGRVPVLILDHADRPLPGASGETADSLMYTTVELGHRFANEGTASLVLVTNDQQQEQQAWAKSGGRDSLQAIRVPALTDSEADDMIALAIWKALHSADSGAGAAAASDNSSNSDDGSSTPTAMGAEASLPAAAAASSPAAAAPA